MSLSIPPLPHNLSSSKVLSPNSLSLIPKLTLFSINAPTTIRMGGGPRTFPGGVSKWQWKRMQSKKAKQLLKARLARERQIYEMRKRAELKAAVSELERPWEVVEKAPTLFSATADEQVKVLADRFQRPGGFDLWSDKDGPQLFQTVDGLPSARFFPKGVVHSIKPYAKIEDNLDVSKQHSEEASSNRKFGNKGNRRRFQLKDSSGSDESQRILKGSNSEVCDMNLEHDGSYGFKAGKMGHQSNFGVMDEVEIESF